MVNLTPAYSPTYMKNSLGTLAAVAAMAVASQSAEASIVVSSISDLAISVDVTLPVDINGDGVDDFYFNAYSERLEGLYNSEAAAASELVVVINLLDSLIPGSVIDGNSIYGYGGSYASLLGGTNALIGFNFFIGEDTHYGWMELAFDGDTPLTLVGAAWESQAGVGITAGAIPEPSELAIASALFAAAAVAVHRRRRRHA